VTRKEVLTERNPALSLKATETSQQIARFLQPDRLVPVVGKPVELLKGKKLGAGEIDSAKVMYDVVDGHMKYSKEGEGWGRGDAVWACESKFGNCTDFHSLFISMARANKIPAKFEMGFSVPTKGTEGPVGGYHCWAWFLADNKGWIPVDISEANRNPEMKDYYFGNLTEDRVQFTTGRDIDLTPKQSAQPLNFFIYPHAEVNDAVWPQAKIDRKFSYRNAK